MRYLNMSGTTCRSNPHHTIPPIPEPGRCIDGISVHFIGETGVPPTDQSRERERPGSLAQHGYRSLTPPALKSR